MKEDIKTNLIKEAEAKYPKGSFIVNRVTGQAHRSSGEFLIKDYDGVGPIKVFDNRSGVIVWSQGEPNWAEIKH